MNTDQLSMNFDQASSFVRTRARRSDCITSREAAKNAVTGKADSERKAIVVSVKSAQAGATAREVAMATGIDYIAVQRRIAECGLNKSELRRDGCAVWVAA